ncbi:hypothetical protein A3H18_05665 [Candidatus Daviesbacteria bacterium RIFCSPLOWO2_12_FULL_38_10]|uniref:Uncharacterized protein n=1 Tax=Candidatus Daviesbacteria bacterium GW2011_GWF2_38_6 TaxID=1618432 RepID=A0A0G0KTQ8_9BACT|nr:MAG: hypothetical protein US99_C0008G0009 [Candidatus Daviesbacteria bacterium GW2011_GWF2_38_6]OGE73184.1 MAG: hypothetical protein A3H18_05665 [Candidatus Daviesbacteria bacterium RIFCSPLOWO2_12_FULL_38_10]
MESSPWLKLITIGLVLAALAVGYFLISGRFASNKTTKAPSSAEQQIEGVSQTAPQTVEPLPSPSNAYTRIVERNKSQVQVLPKTGSPAILISIISLSAIISGWGLRKFPQ